MAEKSGDAGMPWIRRRPYHLSTELPLDPA
jgi:hypothetical protein